MAYHPSTMKIHEIMSLDVRCIGPETKLTDAAKTMRDLDVGTLPICDHDRLSGMLTDRDIVVKAVARGYDLQKITAHEVMTDGVTYVYDDQEIETAARLLEAKQIRRLPVLNREKRLVGILSLGDLALHVTERLSGEALRKISQPATGAPIATVAQ